MGSLFGIIRKYKFFVLSLAFVLIEVTLQLSGFRNMTLAIALGAIAFVLLVIGILGFTSPKATQKIGGLGKTPMKLWPKRKADEALLTMLQEQGVLPSQPSAVTEDITIPKRPKPELNIEIHEYDFGLPGEKGCPPKRSDEDKALWLKLGVTFKMNQTMQVETLHLLLSGEIIQPYDWISGRLVYYYYFEMPQWVKHGDVRTIQLVAFAKGTKWGSEPKEISISSP